MAMDPVAVVRSAWDAFSAGDADAALRFFAPDAEWHVAEDFPGPSRYRGHDELRLLLESPKRFSVHHMSVTEISDMGGFVLAHGVVYAELDGETVVDRVTIWRCRVDGEVIASVEAEVMPSSARWEEPHRSGFDG
jgi:ketosteroid isomerase-like protein